MQPTAKESSPCIERAVGNSHLRVYCFAQTPECLLSSILNELKACPIEQTNFSRRNRREN